MIKTLLEQRQTARWAPAQTWSEAVLTSNANQGMYESDACGETEPQMDYCGFGMGSSLKWRVPGKPRVWASAHGFQTKPSSRKFSWRSFPSSALRSSWQTAPVHPGTSWKWPWIINSGWKIELKTQLIFRSSNWQLASPLCPWSSVWPTASLAFCGNVCLQNVTPQLVSYQDFWS